MYFKTLIATVFIFLSITARAADTSRLLDDGEWEAFNRQVDTIDRENENAGLAYMISGAAVAIGGGIIAHQSTDSVTNFTLSLMQSVGIAGIGYGTGLYYVSEPNGVFRDTLLRQHTLTLEQKNQLVKDYLELKKERERRQRIIAAVTYGLITVLNTYNATQATDNSLRTIYWAIAGANLALSLSFTF